MIATKELILLGREEENGQVNYYIQSGENVYVPVLENGHAVSCKKLNGDKCEGYLYSPRGKKHCKHTDLAVKNEKDRSSDQQQHIADHLRTHGAADRQAVYSCYCCGAKLKAHDGYCPGCAA